jgi:hypothetical protein
MGVAADLQGRKVRCPHCKQIVLAPAPPPTPPARAATPSAAVEPPADDLPVFNLPKEEHDSIFSEATAPGDEVIGSAPAAVPDLLPVEEPRPAPELVVSPVPAAATQPVVLPVPAPQPQDPFTEPSPLPVPVPLWPGAGAAADDLAPEEPEPAPQPARPGGRDRTPAGRSGGAGALFKIGFWLLLPYALLATGLAVYGLFLKEGKPPEGHPLSTVPDNFGEFPPAERRKTGQARFPLDGDLPPELRVPVGGKLAVGAVEIEPLAVEARTLEVMVDTTAGRPGKERTSRPPALVLRMRIRNTSPDLVLYPMDPAFTRKAKPGDQPGTGLVVGDQAFWGGPFDWPPARVKRVYEQAQEADATPLGPGEAREYVVFTDTDPKILDAVRGAADPLLWRVQVRRGRVEYRGSEVPVTAIVGVEFRPSDVAGL